jgi:hypothetical protein
MADLTIYLGNKNYSSWSLRPWLVLKQIGVQFNEVVIPLYEPRSKARGPPQPSYSLRRSAVDDPAGGASVRAYHAPKLRRRELGDSGKTQDGIERVRGCGVA